MFLAPGRQKVNYFLHHSYILFVIFRLTIIQSAERRCGTYYPLIYESVGNGDSSSPAGLGSCLLEEHSKLFIADFHINKFN